MNLNLHGGPLLPPFIAVRHDENVNPILLGTGGIHYLLQTTTNASTKAKLKVEPLNSHGSSLLLSRL